MILFFLLAMYAHYTCCMPFNDFLVIFDQRMF